MDKDKEINKKNFPSVNYAYDIALKSYDWANQRADNINGAIERLLTWISSATIGIVALIAGNKPEISFCSVWFYISIGLFICSIFAGIYAKITGSLSLVSPEKLHKEWLHLNEWEFKSNFIYWAGDDFTKNKSIINRKGSLYDCTMFLFLVEVTFLAIWIISSL